MDKPSVNYSDRKDKYHMALPICGILKNETN